MFFWLEFGANFFFGNFVCGLYEAIADCEFSVIKEGVGKAIQCMQAALSSLQHHHKLPCSHHSNQKLCSMFLHKLGRNWKSNRSKSPF
jgi:hypothetical protein